MSHKLIFMEECGGSRGFEELQEAGLSNFQLSQYIGVHSAELRFNSPQERRGGTSEETQENATKAYRFPLVFRALLL